MATTVNPTQIPLQGPVITGPQLPGPAQFTIQNLTVGPHSRRAPYRQRNDENKTAVHWGQRKLHLSEVEFFTIYWDSHVIPNPLCVYAGAAPGTHIDLLSQMFPTFTFHLYDPADFDVKETDSIKLYKEYFTDAVAARYSGRNDVFFVSDIRTSDYKTLQREQLEKRGITELDPTGTPVGPVNLIEDAFKQAELINEDQIWGDMNMQQNWVKIMNPEHAFLKFRLPYAIDGTDRIVQYLKGIVYWQVWPPQTSTETRLKPVRNANGVYELGDWSTLEYEQWSFYHNTVEREHTFYKNIFTGTDEPIDFPELLNDFDSSAEALILRLYFEKLGITDPAKLYERVKSLSHLITWSINRYRTDEDTNQSLAKIRASPIKSSSKTAIDAFRAKRKGRRAPFHTAFQHTQVEMNPTWRQQRNPAVVVQPTQPQLLQPGEFIQPIQPRTPVGPQPTLQPRTPPVQTTVPAIQPLTPPVQTTVPAIQPIQPRTPPVQTTVPAIQPRTPPVQTTVPAIQPRTPPVQTTVPAIQPRTPPVQTTVPAIQPRTPPVQTTVPAIQPRTPPVQTTVPAIQPRTPPVQTTVPAIQPRTPPVQTTVPAIQPIQLRTPVQTTVPAIQHGQTMTHDIQPIQPRTPPVQTTVPAIQPIQTRTPPVQTQVRTPTMPIIPQMPAGQVTRPVIATPTVPQMPTNQVTRSVIATPNVPQVPTTQVVRPVIATPNVPQVPTTQVVRPVIATPNVPQVPTTQVVRPVIATPNVPQVPTTQVVRPVIAIPNVPQVPRPAIATPNVPQVPRTVATPNVMVPRVTVPQVPNLG